MISIVVFHRSFHFKSGWVPSLASNLVTSYSSRLSGVSCDFNSAKLVIKKKKNLLFLKPVLKGVKLPGLLFFGCTHQMFV